MARTGAFRVRDEQPKLSIGPAMDPGCGALAVRRGGWRIDKQQADLGSQGNVETAYNTDGGAPHECRGRSASGGKVTFRNLLKIEHAR